MLKKILYKIKKIPLYLWLLALIVFVGVFLRTYHFNDWLIFNPDQARDATIVSNALEGKGSIEVGPQAGNTRFSLGPLYYQFEYISAFIFGSMPDKMAYPDLFFSILAIPLFFFFLRKYFSIATSLLLDSIFSVAYFSVSISRFALNPNSLPFFLILFLYGLLEMIEPKNKDKFRWAIVVGIALGVSFQLHTLALLVMPTIAFFVCIYLIFKKNLTWKNFIIVILFFLIANAGQVFHEVTSGGASARHFWKETVATSNDAETSLFRNILLISSCQVQTNINRLSSLDNTRYCEYQFSFRKLFFEYKYSFGKIKQAKLHEFILVITGILFTFTGYIFWIFNFFREKDPSKKNFLALLLLLNIIFLIALIPVASQMELHYFNHVFFVPFIMLGFWLDFFLKNKKWVGIIVVAIIFSLLFYQNISVLNSYRISYTNKTGSNEKTAILGEALDMLNYMKKNTNTPGTVRLDGGRIYLKRFLASFEYLAPRQGIKLIKQEKASPFEKGIIFFYIDNYIKTPTETNKRPKIGGSIKHNIVLDSKKFGNEVIYTLQKNSIERVSISD